MTTNQTIDGVPRELVEWMANSGELLELLGLCSGELRALLDAPVKKRPAWMDEPFAVAARGEERGSSHGFEQSPNTCRHDERSGVWWREGSITRTGRECCACGSVEEDPVKPASQPQGEPVALLSKGFTTLETRDGKYRIITQYKNRDDAWSDYTALCKAEQPAPVAVVLPEHRDSSLDNPNYSHARGWNACLDEVTRLNTK